MATEYFIGIDPGAKGGCVLVATEGRVDNSIEVDNGEILCRDYGLLGCEVMEALGSEHATEQDRLHIVRHWRTLYEPRLTTIERVNIIQRQKNNDKLLDDMGWWRGVVSANNLDYQMVRPNIWKPKTGIPSAPRRATDTQIKALAVVRAEAAFPRENFRGKRGGVTGKDWFAEAALLAVFGMRQYYEV